MEVKIVRYFQISVSSVVGGIRMLEKSSIFLLHHNFCWTLLSSVQQQIQFKKCYFSISRCINRSYRVLSIVDCIQVYSMSISDNFEDKKEEEEEKGSLYTIILS